MDTRDDDRHLEQVAEAWRMRVYEHATQTQIAKALGVHLSTVSRWLTATARDRIGERKDLVDLYFADQLEKLDILYREAVEAWQASKEPRKSVTKRVTRTIMSDPSGQTVAIQRDQPLEEVVVTRVDDQDGDVRYLHAARAILADIRELLGLNGPKLVEVRGPGGASVSNVVLYLPDNDRGDSSLPYANVSSSGENEQWGQ